MTDSCQDSLDPQIFVLWRRNSLFMLFQNHWTNQSHLPHLSLILLQTVVLMTFYDLIEKIFFYLDKQLSYSQESFQQPHSLIELSLQSNVVNFTNFILGFLVKLLGKLLLHRFNSKRILRSTSVVFESSLFLLRSHSTRTSASTTKQDPLGQSIYYGSNNYQHYCFLYLFEHYIVRMNRSARLECV